jgi:hypothetical protein
VSVKFRIYKELPAILAGQKRSLVSLLMTFMYVNSKSQKSPLPSFPGQIIITTIFDDVSYDMINNCSLPIKNKREFSTAND